MDVSSKMEINCRKDIEKTKSPFYVEKWGQKEHCSRLVSVVPFEDVAGAEMWFNFRGRTFQENHGKYVEFKNVFVLNKICAHEIKM